MLSRVANTLYWMVRNVERADNLARLIDVNQQLLLDFESLDSERLRAFWRPIILSTGDEETFDKLYEKAGSAEVVRFLTDDRRNPNSIVSCVALARENARTVRDQLSDELWEELNALHLYVQSDEASFVAQHDPTKFYGQIRRSALAFHGIAASTTARNEAWEFMDLGRYLERADKTTRFLDIANYLPSGADATETGSPGVLHWSAILRSCGAMGAFRAEYQGEITPENVVKFLIFSHDFPRSVRFCLNRIDQSLHRISNTPRGTFSCEAEREAGKLFSDLSFASAGEVFDMGLHEYLDHLQERFNTIGGEIFETYVLMPERVQSRPVESFTPTSTALAWQLEQQQQQQQ
ncbi:MAG: alpha-E domain-containing protein [Luteolibacter sp.]